MMPEPSKSHCRLPMNEHRKLPAPKLSPVAGSVPPQHRQPIIERALLAMALVGSASAIWLMGPAVLHAMEGDPRLVDRAYDADAVVRLEGKVNVQVTIIFAEDERIENVAIGDSAAWQITPNKRANLLFVKPLSPTATTNMTVITDRRSYFFDLVASPQAKPIYALDFVYADDEDTPQSDAPVAAGQAQAVQATPAKDPYAIVNPAALNFAWGAKGDKELLPARIYDDGDATFLVWPTGQPIPALLIKDPRGNEGPVNFAVRGDTIVLQGVPREIVLRSGNEAASLFNQGTIGQAEEVEDRLWPAQTSRR